MIIENLSRRDFLASSAALTLTLGISLRATGEERAAGSMPSDSHVFAPNAFLRIALDSSVLVIVGRSEMGQGVFTSLPMMIAEELDVPWNTVSVQAAPVEPAYDNPRFGMQGTGGSNSVVTSWEPMRRAGATARAMLLQAAADLWHVQPSECETDHGEVIHVGTQRRASYGSLVQRASRLSPPGDVQLKHMDQFEIIGTKVPRLDIPSKTTGTAVFGIDVAIPGMLVALIARPPRFGAKPTRIDASATRRISGVRHVLQIDAGIAIVADNFWAASKGRDALRVDWAGGLTPNFSEEWQRKHYAALLETPGVLVQEQGDIVEASASPAKNYTAQFEFPYLAQTPMEPLNCVANVREDRCEVWVGTQFQSYDRDAAAAGAGLKPEQVTLHTTLLGGGFGRRGVSDGHFVREAVQISKLAKRPIKVVWTRSDDIQGGYFRPAYQHRIVAATDVRGAITGWHHRVVGQSILTGTPFEKTAVRNGTDRSSTYIPFYQFPTYRVELHTPHIEVPVWAWRSVGSTHNAYAIECFMDELAFAAGQDPVAYRRPLLNAQRRAVLELAAEKSNWGSALPPGWGRGIAIHQFDSFVAQVAEVSIEGEHAKVHRIVCAVDCGMVIHPDIARAQIEGAIAMGLSAFLHERISFRDGGVEQSSFVDYPILTMAEMPRVEVHFIRNTSAPKGIGEAGLPPTAPAVANAIFAAGGARVRRLPLSQNGIHREAAAAITGEQHLSC